MVGRDSDTAPALVEALYGDCYAPVHAYALRRTDPDTPQEVVAETFRTAWRRLDDVPEPPLPCSPAYHNVQYRLRNGRRAGLLGEYAGDRHGSRSRVPGFGDTTEGDESARQPVERYDPTAEFKNAYKDGKVREDGETTLAGRRVRRLVIDDPPAPEMDGLQITGSRSTYFVDADTLYPVRSTSTSVVVSPEGRQQIYATMDYTKKLPRTKANLALLKLGARPR